MRCGSAANESIDPASARSTERLDAPHAAGIGRVGPDRIACGQESGPPQAPAAARLRFVGRFLGLLQLGLDLLEDLRESLCGR